MGFLAFHGASRDVLGASLVRVGVVIGASCAPLHVLDCLGASQRVLGSYFGPHSWDRSGIAPRTSHGIIRMDALMVGVHALAHQ